MAAEITNEKLDALFKWLLSREYNKYYNLKRATDTEIETNARIELVKTLLDEALPEMWEFSLSDDNLQVIRRKSLDCKEPVKEKPKEVADETYLLFSKSVNEFENAKPAKEDYPAIYAKDL